MEKELVSIDLITDWIREKVENKIPIAPSLFVETAQKINILLGDEHDKLFDFQQEVAQMKVGYLEEGKSVAEARTRVEASDKYKLYLRQKAKIERIQEFIRLSKTMAKLKDEEYRGGNF